MHWKKIPANIKVCAVTKGRTTEEVRHLLDNLPQISDIGENRWPDCEEKFNNFPNHQKHFIGPLQSNKINKLLPLVDVFQSIDSLDLLEKINNRAIKPIKFCFQVNISGDPAKQGIASGNLKSIIEGYLEENFSNVQLIGLMTIGERIELKQRAEYFAALRKLFDQINHEYFRENPLPILSMGMSEDFEIAIKSGSTMVRLGSCLFE